ncbi:MAG: hypothetical protein HOI47_07270 [Candidatus Scalindua sp.]|nr:hypothetical protein [Candidatus Scalindua sp.]
MSNENFEAKKIISNAMGVVSMEIIGSRDHVEEVWKAISHAVDISYSVNDFYYPIQTDV